MEQHPFDYELFKQHAFEELRNGKPGVSASTLFQPLFKRFVEELLEAEMDEHLTEEQRKQGNRRNGKSRKTVKSIQGSFELSTPRDRTGAFEPQIVGKRQTLISEEIEEKVIRLYSKGMSVRDITDDIEEFYGFTLSPAMISRITDRVIPLIQEWQNRPLETQYCFVFLDAMYFKVRVDGQVTRRVLYNIIGINTHGVKDLLGVYIAENEAASFWMQVLEDLKRRGVQDILFACIDQLTGFAEAIEVIYPHTTVQPCVIHQIRNSMKYISWKDVREFMKDLRTVYAAGTLTEAERNLDVLDDRWGGKYPSVIHSWRNNWERLSTYFNYPHAMRRVMYTTNIIESFHRQVRKVTKTKGAFANDTALLKLVYLATMRMVEKWQRSIPNWMGIAAQLQLIFGERVDLRANRISWR